MLLWAPSRNMKLAEKIDGTDSIIAGELEESLRSIIQHKEIDLVTIDPFIKAYGGNISENDNKMMDEICDIIVKLSFELNFAPDILHHDKKGTLEAGNIDSGRGASSVRDAARLGRGLMKMSPDEAKAFGISETDRRSLIRMDATKVNLVPATEAQWFRLIGVNINNATDRYPHGDTIQVAETWSPPATWEGVSNAIANAILDDIEKGPEAGKRYSSANAAKDRAAWKVVRKHIPDKCEQMCKSIIKKWLESGTLIEDKYYNSARRTEEPGLSVNPGKRPS
jgi:AAA domain-containing protein